MPNSAAFEQEVETKVGEEFDRQVEILLRKGYPTLAGVSEQMFITNIEPLKGRIGGVDGSSTITEKGCIPFVIVINNDLVAAESAMRLVEIKEMRGWVNMHPVEPRSFKPIEGLQLPDGMAYLLMDIDTGRETLNVTPADALRLITKEHRSPLTIDEGVALVTQFPEVLKDKQRYNCFSMLGSRRGDQRVPAMWISYGKPRLGWCWDGNPHTWLGSASCRSRVGHS